MVICNGCLKWKKETCHILNKCRSFLEVLGYTLMRNGFAAANVGRSRRLFPLTAATYWTIIGTYYIYNQGR